jgi:colanic acid/amylovoran biosynthesis glycosyltransferase
MAPSAGSGHVSQRRGGFGRLNNRATSSPAAPAVAYVLTHYPYPSQTFLMQEILGVEAAGIRVARIALNAPGANDLLTDVDRAEHERTTYIKRTSKGAAVLCLARTAARRPLSFAKLSFSAVRSAGADVKLMVWRLLQLAEGAIVWDQCRRDGSGGDVCG